MAKHKLVWMAVTQGQCECGMNYEIHPDDHKFMDHMECQDTILDAHALHQATMKEQGR